MMTTLHFMSISIYRCKHLYQYVNFILGELWLCCQYVPQQNVMQTCYFLGITWSQMEHHIPNNNTHYSLTPNRSRLSRLPLPTPNWKLVLAAGKFHCCLTSIVSLFALCLINENNHVLPHMKWMILVFVRVMLLLTGICVVCSCNATSNCSECCSRLHVGQPSPPRKSSIFRKTHA